MKFLGIYLIFSVIICSCNHHTNDEITQVFQPLFIPKHITTKLYTSGDYDYSPSLFIDSDFSGSGYLYINTDTTFTIINNNMASVGKWQFVNDTVKLKSGSANISYHVTLSKSATNSKVTFIILDKTNAPIQNFLIQPFNNKPTYYYDNNGELKTDANKQSARLSDDFRTDEAGKIRLDKGRSDSIDFTKLYALTGKKFSISTHNLPDTVKLMININAIALLNEKVLRINIHRITLSKVLIYKNRFVIPFD